MKENVKTKVSIIVLVFVSFLGGFSLSSYLSNETQIKQIDKQVTKLVEVNKRIVELEKRSIELKKQQLSIEEETNNAQPIYNFSDDEIYILAQLLCGQGGVDGDGEYDFESQISTGTINWTEVNKVLDVVMNRTLTPGVYADNVKDVVLQPGAFSVFPKNLNTIPSQEVIETVRNWCSLFNSGDYVQATPKDHYWFSSSSRGSNITRNHL